MPSTCGKSGRKGPTLTYRQRQVAHELASSNRRAINEEVDSVLEYIEQEAKRLSKKYRWSVAWFNHQFFQGERIVRQQRAVSVWNAAKQIEGFLDGRKGALTDPEKERFTEIQAKIKHLNGAENACKLPADMQQFLKAKAQAWLDHKRTAPRASTRAVVQDANLTFKRLSEELLALSARTEMEAFMFAVKGKPEHPMPGFFAATNKGSRFLLHGLKKHQTDISKEFESYVLSSIEGLILNHNGHIAELKSKIRLQIRDGLVAITGDAKAQMQFDRYEKLLVIGKGIELINWPDDIPFVNASVLTSKPILRKLYTALTLEDMEACCRWVTLTAEEWENRCTAYYEAHAQDEPKKRKCKVDTAEESQSSSDSSEAEDSAPQPKKRARKDPGSGKENQGGAGSSGNPKQKSNSKTVGGRKVTEKRAEKGKGKAKKGKNKALVPVSSN